MTARTRKPVPVGEDETAPAATVDAPPTAVRPAPRAPRFGISEGTREELARTGRAVDPFTGDVLEDAARLAELAARAKA